MARDPYVSRRAFLAAACGKPQTTRQSAAGPQLASPEHPVTWPITAGNQPIGDGLEPERNAVLKIYNWTDYIDKEVAVNDFQKKYKKYGVKVQISTFNTM